MGGEGRGGEGRGAVGLAQLGLDLMFEIIHQKVYRFARRGVASATSRGGRETDAGVTHIDSRR